MLIHGGRARGLPSGPRTNLQLTDASSAELRLDLVQHSAILPPRRVENRPRLHPLATRCRRFRRRHADVAATPLDAEDTDLDRYACTDVAREGARLLAAPQSRVVFPRAGDTARFPL